mmetsp:Transcript_97879/g.204114  ORF Transcript_97879/g.204114 Transcript_97879/m.204114 type:complete len:273 (-) Transcript_97879:581-1399(-)
MRMFVLDGAVSLHSLRREFFDDGNGMFLRIEDHGVGDAVFIGDLQMLNQAWVVVCLNESGQMFRRCMAYFLVSQGLAGLGYVLVRQLEKLTNLNRFGEIEAIVNRRLLVSSNKCFRAQQELQLMRLDLRLHFVPSVDPSMLDELVDSGQVLVFDGSLQSLRDFGVSELLGCFHMRTIVALSDGMINSGGEPMHVIVHVGITLVGKSRVHHALCVVQHQLLSLGEQIVLHAQTFIGKHKLPEVLLMHPVCLVGSQSITEGTFSLSNRSLALFI